MNKKGQHVMIGIMVFVMVFITLVVLINPIKDEAITARNSNNLDCDNNSIDVGRKGTCVLMNFVLPYFIGIGIFVAFGYIGLKRFGVF